MLCAVSSPVAPSPAPSSSTLRTDELLESSSCWPALDCRYLTHSRTAGVHRSRPVVSAPLSSSIMRMCCVSTALEGAGASPGTRRCSVIECGPMRSSCCSSSHGGTVGDDGPSPVSAAVRRARLTARASSCPLLPGRPPAWFACGLVLVWVASRAADAAAPCTERLAGGRQ